MSAGCPKVMDKPIKVMDKTILVVEDERMSRAIIELTLEAHGLGCKSAIHGQEALTLLSDIEFDLILTDLRMPVLDGIDLIKAIREGSIPLKVSRGIPIVVLSAEEGDMVDTAISHGISGWFIKKEPIDILVPTLKELLKIE